MLLQVFFVAILLPILYFPENSEGLHQSEQIQQWANVLGRQLDILGNVVTRLQDLEQLYKKVQLQTKDPKKIIEEIVERISYMMKKKMDACIIEVAQESAKNFELNETDRNRSYYRSNTPNVYGLDADDPEMYINIRGNFDTHFFHLAVNTNHSAVHVPINIYDRHDEPEAAIRWSEELDKVFTQNYKTDPALYWQYFGSSTGIMRLFPGMEWGWRKNFFDCRIRQWFIEAATCTKDVVILLDNSGSMTGMNQHIASLVIHTLLDTLSNNDYINILNYQETVNYTIPCYKDILVQATRENIRAFKSAMKILQPEHKSFFKQALMQAFELLHKYRKIRGCKESSEFCNQAVMIVTDGVASDVEDLIEKYNRGENGTSIPIRIFTFIVGKEATHLTDALALSCSNRGYYSHVDALEQVTAAVYQYIMVFARPLVLHARNPLSWTHAYYDITYDFVNQENKGQKKFEKYRLLTSVAGPVLDLKAQEVNATRTAKLLGVAGTDVPVEEIAKLMYPYKTGVNSHSFIVSNNGYVLKHPGLRPMFDGILTENYNSIDLSEVEQLDDDSGPRDIQPELMQLRDALVGGVEGVMHDIKIKYSYDNMRRVSREINDYFYAPINGTPFSIAFAIPDLYGNYSIEIDDTIEEKKFSTENISSYFNGSNWKIHPQWVYCKFHYLEGHEYEWPEEELMTFVNKINENFTWHEQYKSNVSKEEKEAKTSCRSEPLDDNAYYCDRGLMKRVVFDAQLTKPIFETLSLNDDEEYWRSLYNVTVRFIATMSGLTRWEYLGGYNEMPSFGDRHPRSIDESWYKSAVIQNRFNDRSFVYAVPFQSDKAGDLLVTASRAIFPKDEEEGISAPAAVVGFQFSHESLTNNFFSSIAAPLSTCKDCLSCGNGLECYVVDSSGYIIISKDIHDVGEFIGTVERGSLVEAMLREDIFEKITVRDYQAICYYDAFISGCNALTSPLNYLLWVVQWIISQSAWLIVKTNLNCIFDLQWMNTVVDAITIEMPTSAKPVKIDKCNKKCNEAEEEWHENNKIPKFEKKHTACEKELDLYVLNQSHAQNYKDAIKTTCNRPFYIRMVPSTNLLLIAVDVTHQLDPSCHFDHTTDIRDIIYLNETNFPCQKLYLNNLTRRALKGCYNEHPNEKDIEECGRSGRITPSFILLTTIIICISSM